MGDSGWSAHIIYFEVPRTLSEGQAAAGKPRRHPTASCTHATDGCIGPSAAVGLVGLRGARLTSRCVGCKNASDATRSASFWFKKQSSKSPWNTQACSLPKTNRSQYSRVLARRARRVSEAFAVAVTVNGAVQMRREKHNERWWRGVVWRGVV